MSFSAMLNAAIAAAGHVLWWTPGRFRIAGALGRSYGLRCVVFHNIAESQTAFTRGIRVTVSARQFETALRYLTAYYNPISLQDVLTDCDGRGLPKRAVLVSFDDAYASVYEIGVPLCRKYRIPAAFFVNASVLDNRRLLPDNLICFVTSTMGFSAVSAAARSLPGRETTTLRSLTQVFGEFLPSLSLAERESFLCEVRRIARINETRIAEEARLYLTRQQLRELHAANCEIGNHTYTHTHCRRLTRADLITEIGMNKAELEDITGRPVRAFSQPYGSSEDLTPELLEHLSDSGHEAAFLSESVANPRGADRYHLDRVSTLTTTYEDLFLNLEINPRLRATRNRWTRAHADGRQALSTEKKPGIPPTAGSIYPNDRTEKRA